MARLYIEGLDDLIRDLDSVAKLPDDAAGKILTAQAEVLVRSQKQVLSEMGIVETGQLRGSIRADSMKRDFGAYPYMEVYPHGVRSNGISNQEVGFIQEYGAPSKGIGANNWMQEAGAACADETTEAGARAYSAWLDSKNL